VIGEADSSKPLYWQVADDVRAQIESGEWPAGTKLPSERAMCDRYGVSQITIRRSLRELDHAGLVYSRHGVGWFVRGQVPPAAQEVESPVTGPDVTLILPTLDRLGAAVVQCLVSELDGGRWAGRSIPVHLCFTDGDEKQQQAAIARWQRHAAQSEDAPHLLLLWPCEDTQVAIDALLDELDALRPYVALFPAHASSADWVGVALDETLCVQKITQHLLSLGYRRVAYLGEDLQQRIGRLHYGGFTNALWEQGLELPLDWVFGSPLWDDVNTHRFSVEGERFEEVFTRSHRPLALVCSSDLYAAEALALLHTLGLRCPEDVALVGVGDHALGAYLPTPLTTLRYDLEGLQRAVVRLVLDLLAGQPHNQVILSGDVVVRASCGARRQGAHIDSLD
jgi:DNA-binding LacI/PurR family transcriptional regulator/DNA-binding transcriptional regulator YhcF (GntR family)